MRRLLDPRRSLRRRSAEPQSRTVSWLARLSGARTPSRRPLEAAMAAPLASASAQVRPVALTVAGPPRILTAFLVPGTRQRYDYRRIELVVKVRRAFPEAFQVQGKWTMLSSWPIREVSRMNGRHKHRIIQPPSVKARLAARRTNDDAAIMQGVRGPGRRHDPGSIASSQCRVDHGAKPRASSTRRRSTRSLERDR